MTKEELLTLVKKIQNILIGCEDAGDGLLDVADTLGVDMSAGAYDEESV